MNSWIFIGLAAFLAWFAANPNLFQIFLVRHEETPAQLVLHGLTRIVDANTSNCGRIAVGYNANLDLIVRAVDVFAALGVSGVASGEQPADHEAIHSKQELASTFGYFFSKGSAAERYVASRAEFDALLDAARSVPPERQRWFAGGNAALMANRFVDEGCQVLLGGAVGAQLKSFLQPAVQLAQPDVDSVQDEVHLIMEYERGATWAGLTAPRANRFIAVHDESNGRVTPLESFHAALPHYRPDLVVVSGLHLLEGQPPAYRAERLAAVVEAISPLDRTVPVHVELASVGEVAYMRELITSVVPNVDSLGLNEQELGTAYIALSGRTETRESFKDPQVGTVVDALKYIHDALQTGADKGLRRLTRIHFHCLTFHLILQNKGGPWRGAALAVAEGSLAASRQACDTHDLQLDQVELHLPLEFETTTAEQQEDDDEQRRQRQERGVRRIDAHSPVLSWTLGKLELHLAPVLVCKRPTKTVGLGDAISAVSLVNQRFELETPADR